MLKFCFIKIFIYQGLSYSELHPNKFPHIKQFSQWDSVRSFILLWIQKYCRCKEYIVILIAIFSRQPFEGELFYILFWPSKYSTCIAVALPAFLFIFKDRSIRLWAITPPFYGFYGLLQRGKMAVRFIFIKEKTRKSNALKKQYIDKLKLNFKENVLFISNSKIPMPSKDSCVKKLDIKIWLKELKLDFWPKRPAAVICWR